MTMGFVAGKPGLPEESERLLQTKQLYPGAVTIAMLTPFKCQRK